MGPGVLDGAISLYALLKLLEPRLGCGAIVVGENALKGPTGYLGYAPEAQKR